MIASQEGNLATVDFLLSRGTDVQALDSLGNTALHHAADGWWKESVDVVLRLLDGGVEHEMVNAYGRTAKSYAESRGYKEIVAVL